MNFLQRLTTFRSIQAKIIVWTGAIILVLLATVIIFSVIALTDMAVKSTEQQVTAEAHYQASRIKAEMEVPLDMARSLAQTLTANQRPGSTSPLTRTQVTAMLRELLEHNPSFLGTWVGWEPNAFDGQDAALVNTEGSDAAGRFVPYWVRGDGGAIHLEPMVDYDTLDYYQCPKSTKQECITDPFSYQVQGKDILMTSVAVPIMLDGQFAGVVGVDIELTNFQNWSDEFAAFENQAQMRLVANNGTYVAIKGQSAQVRDWLASETIDDEVRAHLVQIQNGEEIFQDTESTYSIFTPVQFGTTGKPWAVQISVPQKIIREQGNLLMWRQILIGGSLAIVGLVIIWLFSLQIARPVRSLTTVAEAVTGGRFDAHADITSQDEIGVLAQAFNQMIDRIRQMLENERQQSVHLQESVQAYVAYLNTVAQGKLTRRLQVRSNGAGSADPLVQLGENINAMTENLQQMILQIRQAATDLNSAAAEILAATSQQASGASEQSAAIAQTTTTVDEVRTIAEQSASRAQQVKVEAQQTVTVSQAGRNAILETLESMTQIKERVEGIAENILALSEQTQQVGEIIASVNDIAAQSNMLALNASVEAARAGEHGKGFSVVAVEVRNLAEQSRQATAQVKAILSEIQKATNATVMATEEGTKGVERGVQMTRQSQEAIDQLAQVIHSASQSVIQVAAGSSQQMNGVSQIATAMQNINQATMQSLASTRQAERAAQNLSDLAHNLVETVSRYEV